MRLLLLTLLLTLVLIAKEKVALVIGNKNYTNQTGLNNPINDAKLLRDTFDGMGYEVLEAYNLNLNDLDDKIDAFIKKAHSAKIAVIYYAGHGMGVNGKNYLIPIGTSNLSVSRLDKRLFSVNELKEAVSYASGFGVVMFDACRNSLFTESIRGLSSRGARALVRPTVSRANVLVSFSTSPNTIANDDVRNGKHSPYALALSEQLKANKNSDIRQVMGSIRDRVYDLTSYKENPQETVEENKLGGKQYCLSGICKQGETEETRRLREQIVLLKRQQQNRVLQSPIVVERPIEIIHYAGENATRAVEETERLKNQQNRRVVEELIVPTPEPVSTSKWLVPTNSVCTKNRGKLYKGVCQATWSDAIKICSDSGGRLPTRSELKQVVVDCGGSFTTYDNKNWYSLTDKNRANKSYQCCYKQKGFSGNSWNWTSETKKSSLAWGVNFRNGYDKLELKTYLFYVLCVSRQ